MSEHFVNKFVIRRQSGHPGYQAFDILAAPEDLIELARSLAAKAEDADLGNGEKQLLTRYATLSRGQTSRVYLNFYAAKDLSWHHQEKRSDWLFYVSCLAIFVVFALALVGLRTLLKF